MLGMVQPTQNTAGALSRLQTQKPHLKSICLQYLLLNSHCFCLLKNGMGLIIFFLCAYVPKTEAGHCKWAEVLKDLERIKTSKDIDVSLYTANADEDEECQELVMRCFFLETEVIIQECRIKNCSQTQDVWNIWKNGNESFEKNKGDCCVYSCYSELMGILFPLPQDPVTLIKITLDLPFCPNGVGGEPGKPTLSKVYID
uniref:Interleukin n=1 Tax=Taeniopygia guttata TaxID=59729 RepID=A0A674HHB0_TAEGU